MSSRQASSGIDHRSSGSPGDAERIRELETRCARLQQENEELARSRDDFLATVSHELRSPLTGMTLQLDTILRAATRSDTVPIAIQERIGRLQSQMRRFVRRATTLLDASRLASGNLQLHPETLDLSAHLQAILQDFQTESEHARAPVQIAVQPHVVGQWDAVAVEQVITNLVSNAIKYGNEQPVRIRLTSDGAVAKLEVADRGIGISAADLARVFDRFERLTTARSKPGFGVGLWVVRQLVEAMAGQITVSSTPNEGSTFTVTLPHTPKSNETRSEP